MGLELTQIGHIVIFGAIIAIIISIIKALLPAKLFKRGWFKRAFSVAGPILGGCLSFIPQAIPDTPNLTTQVFYGIIAGAFSNQIYSFLKRRVDKQLIK